MSNAEMLSEPAVEAPRTSAIDMKLEVIVIPVSDIDRTKRFYRDLGWRLDIDYAPGDDYRVIQFTPPGSGCSVIFGKNVATAAPGSAKGLHLIVSDIRAACDQLLRRGIGASEPYHDAGGNLSSCQCGQLGERPEPATEKVCLLRRVQRSGWQRLGAPGGHRAIDRTH